VTLRTISIATILFGAACARPVPAPPPVTPEPFPEPLSAPVVQQAATPVKPSVVAQTADSVGLDSTTIARRATELFGDASAPTLAAADATAAPSWDIEVHEYESTDRVDHYVKLFSGSAKERIQARLERGTRYEPMIRARMREGGIPEDMYYLALIESGFDANAYSRAAAVGMWQFMTSTGRDMGLRIDWWIDERRDPFKSTIAAVRFIKGLRDQFGSLYLAAAAYNGGPGRIARGLTRYADDFEGTTGDDLFFALADKDYLRNETREYVPQLIAAALIAKEPEKYGMKFNVLPPVTYDSVSVPPATALAAVAKAACLGIDDIRELNPEVLRGVTPPHESYFVRVPSGMADSTASALATMPKSTRMGLLTVESKKGETPVSIARENGVSSRQLLAYNPKVKRLKNGNLVAGQTIYVPTPAVASAAVAIPDPEIERYGPTPTASVMHVVKAGETLGGIALRYHTSNEALMKANGLRRPLIFPGQSLVVKTTTAGSSRKSSARTAAKSPTKSAKGLARTRPNRSVTKKAKAAKPKRPAAKPTSTKKSKAAKQ